MQQQPPKALGDLRILDLSRILAGPWATQILGDLGAEVIKVERPGSGDDSRYWGPPFVPGRDGDREDAAYYTVTNRNKASVAIDFSQPEGADLIRRLVVDCDVLVENFKVGGLEAYGLDYASLKALNPQLIYCSITGFGQYGPYKDRGGYDFLLQAMGGLMSTTGASDQLPGGGPTKVGVAVTDLFTGTYAAIAILAALAYRDRTGEGQHIDCSLFDTQVAMLANQAANWLVGGKNAARMGNDHPNVVPYRSYRACDGYIVIACGNDRQFVRLCEALGRGDLAADVRYLSNAKRAENRESLDADISATVAAFTRAEVVEKLDAVGVPCGPINEISDVFADPHAKARQLVVDMVRDDGVPVSLVGFPARLGTTPATYRQAPPLLGYHTESVLRSRLGLDGDALAALRQQQVIE